MRPTMKARIARLETSKDTRARTGPKRIETPRDWLELFEALAATGFFIHEPDFHLALGLYRDAVELGNARPMELEWLLEMYGRAAECKPAASETEYQEVAEWYRRNESAVYRVEVRYALLSHRGGPRRLGATKTFEELRQLRAAHADLE